MTIFSRGGVRKNHLAVRASLFGIATFLTISLVAPAAYAIITPISQSYAADKSLTIGSIASLVENTSDRVELSNNSNAENVLGVVISPDSSLLSVSNGANTKVQIATAGTLQVLVSDINGAIQRGDHITASPIDGVGMKATSNVRVVGIAQSDLSGGNKQSYKDKEGKEQSVTLSEIPVLVSVAYYFKEPDKTIIPATVQNVANALAGRNVSTTPILVSLAIFIVTITVVVSIIYSMVRNGIISVGRNPLSQSAVYRNVIQMSALVLTILGIAMAAIYLVLTKM